MKNELRQKLLNAAQQYGTPAFVYDWDAIAERFQHLRNLLDPQISIYYSLKANPNVAIVQQLHQSGAGSEVCSLTELETALLAGVDPDQILFLGPGKSDAEIERALNLNIGAIIIESFSEAKRLNEIAARLKKIADVVIRVNPLFSTKSAGLTMGGKPRQFGIDEVQLRERFGEIAAYPCIKVKGIHTYMGTRILDAEAIQKNTQGILAMARDLHTHWGVPLEFVDIGGGFGVPYFENETPLDVKRAVGFINQEVAAFREEFPHTQIAIELGRYLVGADGYLLCTVRYKKSSFGEDFLVADGGTNCHMAAVGIGSFVKRNFPISNLTRPNGTQTHRYNITGPLCTPNDLIATQVLLPLSQEGDVIAVERSGAYGPTASPTYFLGHGYPAEVLLQGQQAHLIRERDLPSDLLSKQRTVKNQSERKIQ